MIQNNQTSEIDNLSKQVDSMNDYLTTSKGCVESLWHTIKSLKAEIEDVTAEIIILTTLQSQLSQMSAAQHYRLCKMREKQDPLESCTSPSHDFHPAFSATTEAHVLLELAKMMGNYMNRIDMEFEQMSDSIEQVQSDVSETAYSYEDVCHALEVACS